MNELLTDILAEAIRRQASDVHLAPGNPPAFRIHGQIHLSPREPLREGEIRAEVDSLLTEAQRAALATRRSLCFSLGQAGLGFFRVSVYSHLGKLGAAIRIVRSTVPTLEELGLPELLLDLARRSSGLLLVTGPTGVGKTTTLNALLGRINAEERKKIVTIEDPVEFIHPPGRSLVVQQAVGEDVETFHSAVIHALRQDPDVICIGEMRDLETVSAAMTAAETGHLVLATLHTTGAPGTVSRIVDAFPPSQQAQMRAQLAAILLCTFSQKLLPRADGKGRVLVYELLVATDAVRNMIRESKTQQLPTVVQTGGGLGMRGMDVMIRDAWLAGEITWDTALGAVGDRRVLEARSGLAAGRMA